MDHHPIENLFNLEPNIFIDKSFDSWAVFCTFAAINLNGMRNSLFEKTPLVRLAVCLMGGILIGEYAVLPFHGLPVFGCVVALALLFWRYENVQSVMIAVCFMVLGALLMERQQQSLGEAWPEGEVQYEAVVLSLPVEKPKTMAVDVLLTGNGRKLKCYIYKDQRSRALQIGDGLRIQSRIQADRTFVASWKWHKAEVSLTRLSYLERTKLVFLKWRGSLLQRLSRQGIGADQYAVVAAMALGDKSFLTRELKDAYSVTGASHILALSGLHLGMIYTLLSFFVIGRRWQTFSQIMLILSIWAFVLLVGLPVTAVRSAMMMSVYALLSLGHRDRMSLNTLAFTLMLMLVLNPRALFDVGFQLSFAAVTAILLIVPLLEGVFPRPYLQEHRAVRWVWGMVTVSCAAQIGVAPLIAYYFGRFSTLFLLTNLIVIPTATLILCLSLTVLAFPSLASVLAMVVSGQNEALKMVAAIPGATMEGLHPSILQVVMVYVITCSLAILGCRLGWLPPSGGSGCRSRHIRHGS